MKITDSYQKIFKNKKRILVVLAHPDDNEIICGGLVARLISDKKKVRLLSMTNGGKGVRERNDISEKEFAEIRKNEQINAGKQLGVSSNEIFNLDIPDGELETNLDAIKKVVYHLRQFQPDIIITHNPEEIINWYSKSVGWVNHRDHRHTAEILLDATYPYCRDRAFFPEQFKIKNLKPCYVSEYLFSDSYTHPDAICFDVTSFVDKKRVALKEHTNGLNQDEIDGFLDEIKKGTKSYEVLRYVNLS
ncbi:MAG: PIG-L family deacetylase [Candidatus Shapirobacteria bacterium]|jgi:LmbE family N-acetylglucosaminyl deacetylase